MKYNSRLRIAMYIMATFILLGVMDDNPVNLDAILGMVKWIPLETLFHGGALFSLLLLWRELKRGS